MSENMLRDIDKEQLERLLRSIAENSMTYYFLWDEINGISESQKSCELFSNLTREYYFKLIFYYLKQYRFIHEQMKFVKMPKTELILEKQLLIMAQYVQPHVSYSAINTWLDSITRTVLSRLKNEYPRHSICFTTSEKFSFWRDKNIEDNFWNEIESRQIMRVLERYIFSELEIPELHEILMTLDFEAEYIEQVAEYFRKLLSTVTYHIVARRLGIHTLLRAFYEENIAVIWKPKYKTNNWSDAELFYINLNSILLYPSNVIRRHSINKNLYINHSQFIQEIKNIILHFYNKLIDDYRLNFIFIQEVEFKWNFKWTLIFNFLRQHLMTDVEDVNIEVIYKNITSAIEVRSNRVKKLLNKRTRNVKFAIGMIVTHLHDNPVNFNDHDGVIIGWHRKCDVKNKFKNKLSKTNTFPYLYQCPEIYYVCGNSRFNCDTPEQLHYIILTENNQICYVRQSLLCICHPKQINNVEIGKYFSRFEGTHYVPNENLRQCYPEDTAAIPNILAEKASYNLILPWP
ncbi:F-box only protein 21-like [Cataglyphis hispanica]|uniref:F-box only protein 21-like n=1 Tax=Cataglyphis hispanica TaxID=1086592 RepID=UPI00218047A7|nr:F-box only protein 21-like [Cataglyphis hispanica]